MTSCISSYQPAPFFVLDEVDAALDNTNVAKVANYIRSQASDSFQFIVISLKGSLYERGHSLVGIYRDQDVNSSRTLTLDVSGWLLLFVHLQDSYELLFSLSSLHSMMNDSFFLFFSFSFCKWLALLCFYCISIFLYRYCYC